MVRDRRLYLLYVAKTELKQTLDIRNEGTKQDGALFYRSLSSEEGQIINIVIVNIVLLL